ncbi:unnamed protein product [Adineta steineri]|uniref:Uncharacterized protein n=2 Tax=Adineta steineri TaxID=433720 RepID=A0A815KJH9_9BILA|nr:unnamed protein product [Adineta steineri]
MPLFSFDMSNNEDHPENLSSSSDEDDTTSSSSTTSSDDDEDDEQIDEESDDNLSSLTPKQAYLSLETKRKTLGKRLLELRDELKAQPQADIDKKKRLLTEIKNLREKWIAVQTRLTNLKARLSHSPTPEREIIQKKPIKKIEEITQPETRIIPPPRIRTTSYSSSSRSRSSSRDSLQSNEKAYHDLDALDDNNDTKTRDLLSSRPTTSYRDLTEDLSFSSSPSPSPPPSSSLLLSSSSFSNQIPLSNLSLDESKILDENLEEQENNIINPKETFYNQHIPYPVINDKRELEVVNRQLKNQLRQLEASKSNPLYDQQANLMNYERLKKQNEYINLRIRIEKLKRMKTKTQREKEQNKKQFHILLQEFRKLQRFMRSANREYANNTFLTDQSEIPPSSIPLPPSPEMKRHEENQLPPFDLNKVTGKKILFESSESDEEEETTSEPQVPVSLSASEPRAVPDGFNPVEPPPLPMPSSSSSSATLDAIKTRFANLINAPSSSSSQIKETVSTTDVAATTTTTTVDNDDDDDDDDDENDTQPIVNPERSQAVSAKFNRRRRKTKRNRNKKKNNNAQIVQQLTNENESTIIDHEEAWRRHVAMQLQFSFLKGSNPILRALTAEAHKKLGVSQDDINDFQFDDEMMDYETALILQQQQEFLAAAAANPFNVLHNAAAGSSSSRPNLVDVLSNLNGGRTPSSSEPQTPMGLLQKFFLDANNNANAEHRGLNDLSTTPPPRDISIGKKIVESLTHQDINALLKLSGSEHDDDDEDDYDDNQSFDGDTDDDTNNFSIDDDSNDVPNGNNNNRNYERWERPTPAPSRATQSSSINNKKSTMETLILPSFNRCTHLGKSTKRSGGVERMFPSFSKHNAGPSSTLSLILYGLSSTP